MELKSRSFTSKKPQVADPCPIQLVPGALSPRVNRRGVKLTTHLQLVPRSRQCGSVYPLPHMPSWRSA
jgi:hypothetical protein